MLLRKRHLETSAVNRAGVSSNLFLMVILWSRQLSRSDQRILPDSGIMSLLLLSMHSFWCPNCWQSSLCLVQRQQNNDHLYVLLSHRTLLAHGTHFQPPFPLTAHARKSPGSTFYANCFKGPFLPKQFYDPTKLQSWVAGKSLNSLSMLQQGWVWTR